MRFAVKNRSAALTLAEMVIAVAICSMLTVVVIRLFRDSMKWQTHSLRRTNLQQQLQVALQRITRDLQQSATGGIGVGAQQMSVQRIVDVSSDIPPRPSWETALIVYFVKEDGLWRRTWPPEPPALGVTLSTSHPFRPDPGQLQALAVASRATVVGKNVVSMQLSNPSTMPLTLTLEVAQEGERLTSTRTLSLRNSE